MEKLSMRKTREIQRLKFDLDLSEREIPGANINEDRIKEQISELSTGSQPGSQFLQKVLARHLFL